MTDIMNQKISAGPQSGNKPLTASDLNMPRPDRDEYFLGMTMLVASRSTCARRRVGCVLVDVHGHVLASGYNGVARGEPHCIDLPCEGAGSKSGEGLHLCQAIHAEQNALLQCTSPNSVHTLYNTASPCVMCMRLICNLPNLQRIVFHEEYPHVESRELAKRRGLAWHHRPC